MKVALEEFELSGLDISAEGEEVVADPAAEPVAAAGPVAAAEPADGFAEEKPATDDIDEMFKGIEAEPAAAVVDPAAVPEAYSKALGISEYVKEPAHLEAAVRAAEEVWNVSSGKTSAASMLENFRSANPAQYEKTIREDIIPYIEQITGQKFGGAAAEAPDPMAAMRAEMAELRNAPALERQQREEAGRQNQIYQTSSTKVTELAKGTLFEGQDVNEVMELMARQSAKLGITREALQKELLAGKTDNLEKAFKSAKNAEMLRTKAYVDRMRTQFKVLKGAIPAAKGGTTNAAAAVPAGVDLSTKEARSKWMAQQYKAGESQS